MKTIRRVWPLAMLLCAAGAHAQLYKWVGPDGKVTYSDTPPPALASRIETKSAAGGGINTGGLPYELAEAVRNNPVTLYTTSNCVPCDDGRRLLSERGIPYSEKTVSSAEDAAQLRSVVGADAQLPYLVVGSRKERGYEKGLWNTALTAAGYPESSKLPQNYRNPPAEAAAPASRTIASRQERPADKPAPAVTPSPPAELPPAAGNAPPGFRF